MNIIEIYPERLYAVRLEGNPLNELEDAFSKWQDLDYLVKYFKENSELLESEFWKSNDIPTDIEDLASQVINESFDLQEHLDEINDIIDNGGDDDFNKFFKELGGRKYRDLREYIPQKAYGTNNPSMLRLYAIKIESNCYLIVHGGIKLTKKLQDTPELERKLFGKIDNVRQYLIANGILKETLKEE